MLWRLWRSLLRVLKVPGRRLRGGSGSGMRYVTFLSYFSPLAHTNTPSLSGWLACPITWSLISRCWLRFELSLDSDLTLRMLYPIKTSRVCRMLNLLWKSLKVQTSGYSLWGLRQYLDWCTVENALAVWYFGRTLNLSYPTVFMKHAHELSTSFSYIIHGHTHWFVYTTFLEYTSSSSTCRSWIHSLTEGSIE